MKKILYVPVSSDLAHSSSRQVAAELLNRILHSNEKGDLSKHDLGQNPIPHFDGSPDAIKRSDEIIADLLAAEIVVLAVPMWNFGVPSVLKAWIDHIVRAGVTFRYTANGAVGLMRADQRIFIVEATGGDYSTAPSSSMNHVGPYLRQVFEFLGARKIRIVSVRGTAFRREAALSEALEQIRQIDFNLDEVQNGVSL